MSRDRLRLFAKDVASAIRQETSLLALTAEVKRLLAAAIPDPEFVLDCADAATSAMVPSPSLSPWDNPPLIDDDESEFSVRLIFWPAGSRNHPHRHTFWTVTGVLWNELTFVTYAEPAAGRAPTDVEREFNGLAGAVGAILPPCIHQVTNPSGAPSISLHVFSGPKAETHAEGPSYERGATTWFTEDQPEDGPRLQAADIVTAMIAFLASLSGPRVVPALERLFAVADVPAKLACTKVVSKHDPRLAGQWLYEVAAACSGEDRLRLRAIADRLTST